jgi:hypothetical protein
LTVATPTDAVNALNAARKLPRTLMGGTTAMRAAGVEYLPQEIAETNKAYQIRLARTFLFNGFAKTVRDMAGKVFAKPIAVGDDMPDDMAGFAENVDLTGRNLDVFAHAVFVDALVEGISYILTDMPPAPQTGGRPVTRAETRNRRPWMVHVKAAQVLGWRSEERDGYEVLTQFRFIENITVPDGRFGEKSVQQVWVFSREGDSVSWETWRRDDKSGEWSPFDGGPVSIGEIPVSPVYVARTGFMAGTPPLADLAEINLSHWQSQSDQRNILHIARVPILFGSGIGDHDSLEIGAARMVTAEDKDAKLTYVEHSGAAIGAGRDDLKDLEFQMQTQGLDLLIPRPGGQTATGAAIDQAKVNAPLTMMALALKDALEQAFGFMALYAGLDRDQAGGSLTVNTDFAVGVGADDDAAALAQAVTIKALSRATYLRELKRRGILSDSIDPDEESEAALSDGFDLTE